METFEDINGTEIEKGQKVTYSAYTPSEIKQTGIVTTNIKYGGLWVNSVPIRMLIDYDSKPYRKLTVISN